MAGVEFTNGEEVRGDDERGGHGSFAAAGPADPAGEHMGVLADTQDHRRLASQPRTHTGTKGVRAASNGHVRPVRGEGARHRVCADDSSGTSMLGVCIDPLCHMTLLASPHHAPTSTMSTDV